MICAVVLVVATFEVVIADPENVFDCKSQFYSCFSKLSSVDARDCQFQSDKPEKVCVKNGTWRMVSSTMSKDWIGIGTDPKAKLDWGIGCIDGVGFRIGGKGQAKVDANFKLKLVAEVGWKVDVTGTAMQPSCESPETIMPMPDEKEQPKEDAKTKEQLQKEDAKTKEQLQKEDAKTKEQLQKEDAKTKEQLQKEDAKTKEQLQKEDAKTSAIDADTKSSSKKLTKAVPKNGWPTMDALAAWLGNAEPSVQVKFLKAVIAKIK